MATMKGSVSADPHGKIEARYFRSEVSQAKAVVFLFHGRGGDAESVYQRFGQSLMQKDVIFVVPQAYSNCWYPFRFNEPIKTNQPWLDSALAWIERHVSLFEERGVSRSSMIFGGFSQGSCLALEYILRYPNHYGGAFALSGGVMGSDDECTVAHDKSLVNMPVLLGCADYDEWIPRERFDQSVKVLERSGAKVDAQVYPNLGHEVCEDELIRIRSMIEMVVKRD